MEDTECQISTIRDQQKLELVLILPVKWHTVLERCGTEYRLRECSVFLDYLLVSFFLTLMCLLPALIAHIHKGWLG